MRVTDRMVNNQVNSSIQKNRVEMSELQNQASTQKRINKPSDDPTGATRTLGAKTEERGSKQFLKNIVMAKSFLEYTDQSLSDLSEILVRAKELAIQQGNDAGASADTRRVVASELEQIYNQSLHIGNRKMGDRYVFAGFKTPHQPFNHEGEYLGDEGEIKIQINKDAFVPMNISGDKIFLGEGLADDGLIKSQLRVPKDSKELAEKVTNDQLIEQKRMEMKNAEVPLRGPASVVSKQKGAYSSVQDTDQKGINVLKTLKDFEIALRTNDKEEVQSAIDNLDTAITQVINARSTVGARLQTIGATHESLQKAIVDNKITASQLEDADLFEVVSDINKADSTLKATLETSARMTNKSLLDFLR